MAERFADGAQATRLLAAAALPAAASTRPIAQLSSGERAQAALALELAAAEAASRPALFDEFGSAWDPPTARRVGAALSAAVRSGEAPPVVLAGCHHALVAVSYTHLTLPTIYSV